MNKSEEPEDSKLWIQFPPDFPVEELFQVADVLAAADVCVPGYAPPEVGLYQPEGFIYGRTVDGIETLLLPDRNVVSRMAKLATGEEARDEQMRLAAAILGFAQCLRIEIEPSIAFHELAHRSGNDAAWSELAYFRTADRANPLAFLEIALGSRLALPRLEPHDTVSADLAKPLKRWNRNYILALKVYELELMPFSPLERVLRLLEWMTDDFIFGGPAALLAVVYFAPNSPPKRRVFKDKNSLDREAAIAGIRNAAWDLTHISDFVRRVDEQGQDGKTRYLFASFDVNLRRIARLPFEYGTDQAPANAIQKALVEWWPSADANVIHAALAECMQRVRSRGWVKKTAPSPTFIDDLIREGEERVRSTRPGQRG